MGIAFLNILIISLVLSFVTSLVLLILSKRLPLWITRVLLIVHISIALGFLIYFFTNKNSIAAWWFALWICSGIICFACVIRNAFSFIIKLYFSIFMLSFPVFLFSPSRVFTIMSLGNLSTENANEILLENNLFLAREQGMVKKDEQHTTYKVIKRMGIFNKTIARNIYFGFTPDSAKILYLEEKSEIRLRAYRFHHNITDSADAEAKTIASRDTALKIIKKQQ